MKIDDSFSLVVGEHRLVVRRREGSDTVFDATFLDPLPSGPGGFTVSATVAPTDRTEWDDVSEVIRSTAETLIQEYADKSETD